MQPVDNKHLSNWDVITEVIDHSTSVDQKETYEAQLIRIRMLEANPELWFQYYFPNFAYAPTEAFHRAATRRLIDNPEWYEVRLWSRELAKSTRAMMEVFYLTLVGQPVMYEPVILNEAHGPVRKQRSEEPPNPQLQITNSKKNVLLISNSLDNAIRLLMPYKANLEVNNRIINDYGIQEKSGFWEKGEFTTRTSLSTSGVPARITGGGRGGVAFRAVGAGQSPRGSKNDEVRPDIILFDDIDTDEECRNPDIIKKKWNWIEEAVMPTRSISKPTTILFCGNRIATDCCVQRATQHADHTDEINIRDVNGKSTWPSKNTEAHIDRVLSKLSYAAIQKEYYNNPINEGSVFKEMAYTSIKPLEEYNLLVCYTDPSYRESKKNDYKATVLVGKWKGEFHVLKAFVFQGTTAQMIAAHYEIMKFISRSTLPTGQAGSGEGRGEVACYYYMEQVFLQDMFMKEFHAAGAVMGKTIPIRGDCRAKGDKFVRIESLLEPLNRNGQLFLNVAEKDSIGMKTLDQQFIAFAPGSRAHDDGPDAVEGAVWLLNNIEQIQNVGAVTTITRERNKEKSF